MPPQPRPGGVLVVEDDVSLRGLLVEVLTQAGYRVLTAANGRDALSCLRGGEPVALILLDLLMPLMDGWQFRAEQRRDPGLRHIPVIVVSGEPCLPYEAEVLGAAAYLEKPTPISRLLGAVRTWFPLETAPAA